MVQFAPINFGLIIAYILPGTVAVYGLRYLSPRIDALWSILERGQAVLGPVPAQNSTSCEIRGLRRVRCDEMHELSRTPIIPDRAGHLGSWCVMGILHAMA